MSSEKQATWGGRFSEGPDRLMQLFSESVSFDAQLAPYDIECSKAHASMLSHVGVITVEERDAIHGALEEVLDDIKAGRFKWDIALEDVHMNIEQALAEKTPASAKLHTARSRTIKLPLICVYFSRTLASLLLSMVSGKFSKYWLNLQSNQSLFLYLDTLICNVRSL